MDSGNSGSLQSSSGGDEEYDSRAAVDHHIFMATQPQPPPLFDTFSNYTQPLRHTNAINPIPPLPWSTPLRPDLNPHPQTLPNPFTPSFRTPPPAGPDTIAGAPTAAASTAARNPRKRSRASRRAPTTVLTTDTTNFRDMVQEFTGVPAPPFTGASFSRPNRFQNPFGPRSASVEAAAQPYPRLPSADRFLTPPFFHPTSTTNSTSSSNINYQQFPFSNNNNKSQNLFFNSLLQRNPSKFVVSDSSAMASQPTFDFQSEAVNSGPGLDVFGLDMGLGPHAASGLNNIRGLISSDRAAPRINREDNTDNENSAKWRRKNSSDDNQGEDYDQARMQPVNGRFEFSGFHLEKGLENIPTTRVGDQGMVESWINSSE